MDDDRRRARPAQAPHPPRTHSLHRGNIDGVTALEARTTPLQAQLDARTAQVQALQGQVDAQAGLLAQMEARLRAVETAP